MIDIASHILVFAAAGVVALLLPLGIGFLVRPKLPSPEKLSTYECGEPTIGTSYIQFDLRFYVVALLFIIFDVEVAFFFPWAAVYGGALQLANTTMAPTVRELLSRKLLNLPQTADAISVSSDTALQIGMLGFADILVFFAVLMVGFAYVWKRGDLDWVRAVTGVTTQTPAHPVTPSLVEQESRRHTVAT